MTTNEPRTFRARSTLGGAKRGNPINGHLKHDQYTPGIFMRFGKTNGVLTRQEATNLINDLADLLEEKD